jgi:hypothetical protein
MRWAGEEKQERSDLEERVNPFAFRCHFSTDTRVKWIVRLKWNFNERFEPGMLLSS